MKTPKLNEEQIYTIKNRLVREELLQEVWDIDSGNSIYKLTIRGKNILNYCALELHLKNLFGWEWKFPIGIKPDGKPDDGPKLFVERLDVIVKDDQEVSRLTPHGADMIYCLVKLIDHKLVEEPKEKVKGKSGDPMQKFGLYMFKFMKAMNKISKVAQKYDTNMTKVSKNSFGGNMGSLGDIPKNNSFGWDGRKPNKSKKRRKK